MCYTVFLETNRGAKYMKLTHKHTLAASYLGYITQAVVNNLTPLLFVVFETSLGISIGRISLLITVNFGVQMLVDLLSAKWINVIGTRRAIVAAHAFAVASVSVPEKVAAYADVLVSAVGQRTHMWACCVRFACARWAAALPRCSSVPSWRRCPAKTRPAR